MSRKLAVLTAVTALCAALAVPALAAATPRAGSWKGKVTKGQAMSGKNGMPTFKVSRDGKKLKGFTIPGVGGYCFVGYRVVSVYVAHASIKRGKFSGSYRLGTTKEAKVTLNGHFTSPTTAKGIVKSRNPCLYNIRWVAHLK